MSTYKLKEYNGATYYAIFMVAERIAKCIACEEKTVLLLSVKHEGQYGLRVLALSVRYMLGKDDVERIQEIPLLQEERKIICCLPKLQEHYQNCSIGSPLYV